jgi:hypothetical protein
MALCRGWALPGIPANTDDVLLIVRFAGVSAAVERHLRVARSLGLSDSGAAGPQIWSAVAAFNRPTDLHQIILRIGVRPAALGGLVALLGQHSPPGSAILGLPGVGLAHVGWPLIDDYAVRMAALRAAILPHAGYLVVEAASATIEAHIDRWGPAPATLGIMRSLRAQWDPAAIVNRGRFMVDSPTV